VLEDEVEGHVWIGTQDGLNRFDGYRFKVFRYDAQDKGSLSNNQINVLFQDRIGQLWVGTTEGLNVFNRTTETFLRLGTDPVGSFKNQHITALAQDPSGSIWVGTEEGLNLFDITNNRITHFDSPNHALHALVKAKITSLMVSQNGFVWIGTDVGLYGYDSKKGRLMRYHHETSRKSSISSNEILTLFEDNIERLWVGTSQGLNLYLPKTDSFRHWNQNGAKPISLTNNDIRAINQDHQNRIWIGTRWGGVNILDVEQNKITAIINEPENPTSLSNNTVLSILKDRNHNMWVGVSGMGINIHDPFTARFAHFKHKTNDPKSLPDDEVWSILKDHKGKLWVGTYAGICAVSKEEKTKFYRYQSGNTNSLSSDQVTAIYQDRQKRLWVGTIYGLNLYDEETDSFLRFNFKETDPESLSNGYIRCVYQDRENRIWIGTEAGGLNRFDPQTKKFERFEFGNPGPNSTAHEHIQCITQDRNGLLWMGTERGISVLNPKTRQFKHYQHDDHQSTSLSNNLVRTIIEDSKGRIWIGTEGGLNLFNPVDNSFTHWGVQSGLSNEVIYAITVDSWDNLWLSTNKGINKFDPVVRKFQVYDRMNGLQSDEFNTASYFKDADGFMYFGGPNGFNVFHPDSIKLNSRISPIALTDFLLLNQSVSIRGGARGLLTKSINHTGLIELNYDDDLFAVEFAALNFTQPEKIRYAYKLEPFQSSWIFTDYKDRKAVFTKIPPGKYILKIKASSESGLWDESVRTLAITVIPPWHQRWWARLLFGLIIVITVATIAIVRERNARRIRQTLRNQVAKKTKQLKAEKEEVSKQLAEKEILMHEVHHRVKNNLTFLKSLLYLRAKASPEGDVRVILDECQARIETMALVHHVLYDRNLNGIHLADFLAELFQQLQAIFHQENVVIDLNINEDIVEADINRIVTIGLIINELTTNSFKYAFGQSDVGKISIGLGIDAQHYTLRYSDSGQGLPQDFDFENSKGFGFRLIHILTQQLKAEFSYSNIGSENTFLFVIPK
jgi:ligand-binding sensor domain-containing protein/two-component sensor histidine kinase